MQMINRKITSRKAKLFLTTGSSIILQMVTIVAGFILPKMYLLFWGSDINGLVSSITQFLSLISFLDLGVGQVVQSSLYEPLANKDNVRTSKVLTSGKNFFRMLARIFAIYTIGVALLFPFISKSELGYGYVFLLVIILSINSFSQYYFGVNYQILLNADQRGYVQTNVQIVTLIINLIACVVLLNMGWGLHFVKMVTTVIYLMRPLYMYYYVRNNYPGIRFNIRLTDEPITQKWDGFAQHIASVILNNTDIVVLTLFSSLKAVSIYTVYNLVISGVKQFITSALSGTQAILGELWAKSDKERLPKVFSWVEWFAHTITAYLLGCTCILIVPFVKVYSSGITDANYIVPIFAYVLTLAHAFHSIRLPYNMMILAGGHFKQTQMCYISTAIINIIISVIGVLKFGLVGVAIGTLIAMSYQTMWLVAYLKANFFEDALRNFFKQLSIDIVEVALGVVICQIYKLAEVSYFSWLILAVRVGLTWLVILIIVNSCFCRDKVSELIRKVKRRKK